jgi:hypothetical protein
MQILIRPILKIVKETEQKILGNTIKQGQQNRKL